MYSVISIIRLTLIFRNPRSSSNQKLFPLDLLCSDFYPLFLKLPIFRTKFSFLRWFIIIIIINLYLRTRSLIIKMLFLGVV